MYFTFLSERQRSIKVNAARDKDKKLLFIFFLSFGRLKSMHLSISNMLQLVYGTSFGLLIITFTKFFKEKNVKIYLHIMFQALIQKFIQIYFVKLHKLSIR